jgi:hypothetical protein
MIGSDVLLRKTLTANDVGATGSHQVGVHVPKPMAAFFPPLVESTLNPEAWLHIRHGELDMYWRYIHYNNAVVRTGTRDEYRLTHVTGFLRGIAAAPGDVLEFTRIRPLEYRVQLLAGPESEGGFVLSTHGPWRVVRLHALR